MPSNSSNNLRRNGKPQSCEPCRLSKQKCDHTLPKCTRCVKRKREDECIYHPSPMTKCPRRCAETGSQSLDVEQHVVEAPANNSIAIESIFGPRAHSFGIDSSIAGQILPRSSVDARANLPGPVESPGAYRPPSFGSHPSAIIGSALYNRELSPTISSPPGRAPDGYMGPTSYAAIFRENKIMHPLEDVTQHRILDEPILEENPDLTEEGRRSSGNLEVTEQVERGAAVLHYFPSRNLCDLLLDRYFKCCDVVLPEQAVRICHDSIWSIYGKNLESPRDHVSLRAMSQEMCNIAMSPIPASSSTEDWMSSFSGHRLRWEVLGNYFALFGLAAMTLSDWDPIFTNHHGTLANKKKYGGKMRQCAEGCLAFCNDIDALNEWVIALMMDVYSLQSFHEGDSSQQLWRRHGGMASAVTAAGLHREADPAYSPISGLETSFLVAEFRRRLFCTFFSLDKQLATFMGRPPALSRRYATCKIPLDLTEKEMMATGGELDAIRSRLDANGWNTSGVISPNTSCRGWINVMVIRDEILELALGPPDNNISARRDELKRKSQEKYAQMPAWLQYQPDDPKLQTASAFNFVLQVAFYQEWLLNDFLLDRLPDGGSAKVKQDLINTARKMLDGVLVLCANRDRLGDHPVAFVWAISYSGIPSAAILSIELLRQSKSVSEFHQELPRSEIIQNLSIFIGCLEWVRPTEGNHQLCVRMRKIIKCILDQVLELPPPSRPIPLQEAEAPDIAPSELPISSLFEPGDGRDLLECPDFLECLNSVDWTRDMLQDAWT